MALGFMGIANLAMMAYSMFQKNSGLQDMKKSMKDINNDIDGGKESETDEVTEDGKMPSSTDFLASADSKTKPKNSFGSSGSSGLGFSGF